MAAWETQGAIGKAKEVAAKATDEAQDETGERRKSVGLAGKMAEKGWSRCSCFCPPGESGQSESHKSSWLAGREKKKKEIRQKIAHRNYKFVIRSDVYSTQKYAIPNVNNKRQKPIH